MNIKTFFCFLLVCTQLLSHERISHFVSDIVVNKDASLLVTETIEVFCENKQIRHGIIREFPTTYNWYAQTQYVTDFDVKSVTCNGKKITYHIEDAKNGKRMYIGSKKVTLSPGTYTFTIVYSTNRQIGFFEKHDELSWNVTGNGWRLPITRAEAFIHLPKDTLIKEVIARTGRQGSLEEFYVSETKGSTIHVYTTKSLYAYHGLSVAVSFAKGYVQEPSMYQQLSWFIRDNIFVLLLVIALLLLIILSILGGIQSYRLNKSGTVIPLFFPPKKMSPSQVGYVNKMKYTSSLLAADIVYLGVRKFLTITKDNKNGYKITFLHKRIEAKDYEIFNKYGTSLLKKLFATKDTIHIATHNKEVEKASQLCKEHVTHEKNRYMHSMETLVLISGFLSLVIVLSLIGMFGISGAFLGTIGLGYFNTVMFQEVYQVYTTAGRKLQDEIDGFKLYLTTAELDRMEMVGTPPDRTPELYETYLPYAIALGVEKQWTKQFVSVFAKYNYQPSWYDGTDFYYTSNFYSSSFASSFSSTISSAATPPGSSSVFGGGSSSGGGGFSSGGGGGGGGGGGW